MSRNVSINHNDIQDTTIYDGCSFYFVSRRNNADWECNLQRPFLLHVASGRIIGQFISTMWYNKQVGEEDTMDFVVLRLPRRDNTIHPDEVTTKLLISHRLKEAEQLHIPFHELDFVILHKRYTPRDIAIIFDKCHDDVEKCPTIIRTNHQDKTLISHTKVFGLSFDMVKQERVALNTKLKSKEIRTKTLSESQINRRIPHPANVTRRTGSYNHNNNTLYVSCPTFELQLV